MTNNIHILSAINSKIPHPDVIKTLEELLEMAKSGELKEFAYCYLDHQLASSWGWSCQTNMCMLGAIEALKLRFMSSKIDIYKEQ